MTQQRIAVVSDTHELGDGQGSPPELLQAVEGSSLILHCGDLETLSMLDWLESVAPVFAVRGFGDPFEPGERLSDAPRVVEACGLRIGMTHDMMWPGPPVRFGSTLEFPAGPVDELMLRKFGEPVDIVCFGDTHQEYVGWYQGTLFLNPGSPTCPANRHGPDGLGTLALLCVQDGVVSVEIRRLTRRR